MHIPVRPRLRPWRRAFAFKQKEIASLLGLKSTTHISRIENGRRAPSLEIAIALELLTGEQIRFLFPARYGEIEARTLHRARRMLDRLGDTKTSSAARKRELLLDVLDRAGERAQTQPHVE